MYYPVDCPDCGRRFLQLLPDVDPTEADHLEATDQDEETSFKCLDPICKHEFVLKRSQIGRLPRP
jgi:hypothetical protein